MATSPKEEGRRKKRMKGRKEAGAIAVTLAGERETRKKGERVSEGARTKWS